MVLSLWQRKIIFSKFGRQHIIVSNNTKEILKSHSLRVTPLREQVLNLFLQNNSAISNRKIQDKLQDADRITIYRTIKVFVEKGVIHEAFDGTDTPKYALCEEHCDEHNHHDQHVHFHCYECDQTFCVEEIEIPYISTPKGYQVKSTNIVLNGKCGDCSAK